jgi:hypothetical protein
MGFHRGNFHPFFFERRKYPISENPITAKITCLAQNVDHFSPGNIIANIHKPANIFATNDAKATITILVVTSPFAEGAFVSISIGFGLLIPLYHINIHFVKH